MGQNNEHFQELALLPPFYEWLQQKRDTLKISQEKLGAHFDGISRNAYAAWERGESIPSLQSQEAINIYFGENVFAQVRLVTKQEEMGRLVKDEEKKRRAELAPPPPLPASPEHDVPPLPILFPFRAHVQKTFGSLRLLVVVVGLLVVLIGLLAGFLYTSLPPLSSKTPTLIGHVTFLSSGLVEENSTNGIADRVHIDVQAIPPPQAHKQYYGWLVSDAPESPGVFLGKLPVVHGAIHYTYNGDETHTNLLNTATNFRLTEEDDYGNIQPLGLSLDKQKWRFVASIPDNHPPDQQFGLRDHIQHLLAVDGTLYQRGLQGGLSMWLNRALEENVRWALQARQQFLSSGSAFPIRDPLIRMLNTLDGTNTFHLDMSPQHVLLDGLDKRSAVIPLLPQGPQSPISESATTFEQSSYISHVDLHLRGIHALAVDSQIRTQAQHMLEALISTTYSLTSARDMVKQLLRMTDAELLQHSTLFLLDTLIQLIEKAYAGPQGIYQIVTQTPQLASMDIQKYL